MPKHATDNVNAKRKGKRLVMLGAILLLSFITQNYLYDKWNEETQDRYSSFTDRSLIDKSILLNETLFFTSGLDNSQTQEDIKKLREQYIREAARKTALSSSVAIAVSDLGTSDMAKVDNQLLEPA